MESLPPNKTHPIIMFRDHSCSVRSNEGKYVFVAWLPLESINKNAEKVQGFLRHFPRLNDKELLKAGDGIYTWLLYSTSKSEEVRFICTEVVSPFELGTRHQALVHNSRFDVYKIYGGGELFKDGLNIKFNLLSGTYSKPILQFDYSKNKTNALVSAFLGFFPQAEHLSDKNSLINEIILIKPETLEMYKKAGYTVRLFDDKNACINFNTKYGTYEFNRDYYNGLLRKAIEDKNDANIYLYRTQLIETLQNMLDMMTAQNGSKRKSRRRSYKLQRSFGNRKV